MENTNQPLNEAVWPQEGAPIPEFATTTEALAAIALACNIDPSHIQSRERLGISLTPSVEPKTEIDAWFAGVPRTSLIYLNATTSNFHPTAGATVIARNIQDGGLTPDQLTTPPGIYGIDGIPLLRPKDADEIDPEEEAVGVLAVDERCRVVMYLADGTVLSFTEQAAAGLEDTGVDPLRLHGETVVVRVGDVEVVSLDGDGNEVRSFERMAIEVFFEGE